MLPLPLSQVLTTEKVDSVHRELRCQIDQTLSTW
jgi:hypothetical protein